MNDAVTVNIVAAGRKEPKHRSLAHLLSVMGVRFEFVELWDGSRLHNVDAYLCKVMPYTGSAYRLFSWKGGGAEEDFDYSQIDVNNETIQTLESLVNANQVESLGRVIEHIKESFGHWIVCQEGSLVGQDVKIVLTARGEDDISDARPPDLEPRVIKETIFSPER